MRLYHLHSLEDTDHGHVFHRLVDGAHITAGELLFLPPGQVAHADEPRHVHASEEIFVLLQGRAVVHFDDGDELMGPGDVMVVEPDENHHLESDAQDPPVLLYVHCGGSRPPGQEV